MIPLKRAKRRLTYKDGTTFIETVVDIESGRIVLELSEYPWSCTKLYANLFTTKVDDGNSVFNVALMYNFTEDSDDTFKNWRFIVFFNLLFLIMIGSSHTADKKVHRIARLSNEAKELKSEYLDVRKQLTQTKMESKLTAVMSKTGLQTSTIPPQKIIITKKQ